MSWILVVDTATSSVIVAAGSPDGHVLAERSFPAEHRHGERLLPEVERLMAETDRSLADLAGIVVGTGPGAFTGLRVGLATAKTLAHGTGCPIAGVSTAEALLAAVGGGRRILALPAGPHDRVVVRPGSAPVLVAGGEELERGADESLVAVDLAGRAPEEASAAGARAVTGLATSLLTLGIARLAAGGDDPELLVPEYVTLPRGVREVGAAGEPGGGIAWSRGPR